MLGQLFRSTGIVDNAIALDALEATCVYGLGVVFALMGVFGTIGLPTVVGVTNATSDNEGGAEYTPASLENSNMFLKCAAYTFAAFGFSILFLGMTTSIATTMAAQMRR